MMSHKEVADYFGCSTWNIRKIEAKALKKLASLCEARELLKEIEDHQHPQTMWDIIEERGER